MLLCFLVCTVCEVNLPNAFRKTLWVPSSLVMSQRVLMGLTAFSEISLVNSPRTSCKTPKTKKQYLFQGESLKSKYYFILNLLCICCLESPYLFSWILCHRLCAIKYLLHQFNFLKSLLWGDRYQCSGGLSVCRWGFSALVKTKDERGYQPTCCIVIMVLCM